MIFIRSLLANLAFYVVLIACILFAPILFFLPKKHMLGIIHFQSIHTKISLKLFANLEVEYRGLENIPKERKYLIAAKHQSLAEAIFLNDAIKENKNKLVDNKKIEIKKNLVQLKYIVQIMVVEGDSLSAEDIKMLAQLGKIDKTATGSDMYEYYAGTFNSFDEANKQLEKARKIGFTDAFIFATNNDERISIEKANSLLKEQSSK